MLLFGGYVDFNFFTLRLLSNIGSFLQLCGLWAYLLCVCARKHADRIMNNSFGLVVVIDVSSFAFYEKPVTARSRHFLRVQAVDTYTAQIHSLK